MKADESPPDNLRGCGALLEGSQIPGSREYQEDSFSMTVLGDRDPDGCDLLMVVADGMGGHRGGAEASRLAVETFLKTFSPATGGVAARLRASLDAANAAIGRYAAEHPRCAGMGCTLVACVVTDDEKAHWISVGDSPLWRLRAAGEGGTGGMERLNADHSMRPVLDKLLQLGHVTEGEAESGAAQQLRSAVIGEDLPLVDENAAPVQLELGDRIVLASDGLETLPEEEILRLGRGDGASAIVSDMLQAVEARARPSQDNATVVVYQHAEAGALRKRLRRFTAPTQPVVGSG